jgi:transposase
MILLLNGGRKDAGFRSRGGSPADDAVAGMLDDWVDEGNSIRAVDCSWMRWNCATSGFDGVDPAASGRPAYHPSPMLKLYIYGYLNRVQSSRRLEREAGPNLEVMWLTGRLAPDHKTIADFRNNKGAPRKPS